jgi:hypothetical protein
MTDKRMFIGLIITLICVTSNAHSADKMHATSFSLIEDRISEGRELWINGGSTGVEWTNVKTSNGNATGTMNRLPDGVNLYDDSVAILKGDWGADQTVEAVVSAVNRTGGGRSGYGENPYDSCDKEVELILRGNITANSIKLYEVLFSSRIDGTTYHQIGVWYGSKADFAELYGDVGRQYEVYDGDVVKATMIGSKIKVYINNVQISEATDTTHTTGKPGIGFYSSKGCNGIEHNDEFGFSSYKATALGMKVPDSPSILSIR